MQVTYFQKEIENVVSCIIYVNATVSEVSIALLLYNRHVGTGPVGPILAKPLATIKIFLK